MAEHSGFFNALKDADGIRDRKYNANDYCDGLAAIISNGVVRGKDEELRVTASGMAVSVNTGWGWIDGHWYRNDSVFNFSAVTAPTGNARYDRVFLTLDDTLSKRKVYLQYRQGTAAQSPQKPAPIREGKIYELVLADVYVPANATQVSIRDQRSNSDLCGWVYSTIGDNSFFEALDNQFDVWFENTKDTLATVTTEVEYKQFTTLMALSKTVSITIPQYDSTANQKLAVYVNGLLQNSPSDYSVSGKTITFVGSLIAGTEITIVITVSKDGSGIPSVVDDVTDLQTRVAALELGLVNDNYTYICNGSTDNVNISNLVTAYLNGGTDYGQLTIHIYGTFGATAPAAGSGTAAAPYRWFNAGLGSATNRRVVLDFENCSQITLPTMTSGSYYVVFFGLQTYIRNCNIVANGAGAYVYMFSTADNTVVNAENCRFWITALSGHIARGGSFTNCRVSLTTMGDNSYAFPVLSAGLLRLYGGEYYAYAPTGYTSAVVYVSSAQTNAVVNTYSINCPTTARSGYVQSFAINCLSNNAKCSFTDTITSLTISATGQNIRGTIAASKPGMM